MENKSATTTETTVTTVLQRTRTILCSGILRGPSGGGVEPAGRIKGEAEAGQGGASPDLDISSCWSVHLAGALISGSLSGRSWSTSSLSSSPRPRAQATPVPAGTTRVTRRCPGSARLSPDRVSLKTARGGQVRDRPQ